MEENPEVVDLVLKIKGAFSEKLNSFRPHRLDEFCKNLQSIYASEDLTQIVLHQRALNRCIPIVGKEFYKIIETVFTFRWFSQEPEIIKLFSAFVANLLSIHPFFSHSAVSMLVENLQWSETPCNYLEVHDLVKKILCIIPSITPYLISCLNDTFPHATQPLVEQEIWFENIFVICDYLPVLRNQILELVIEKLIEVDLLVGEVPEGFPSATSPLLISSTGEFDSFPQNNPQDFHSDFHQNNNHHEFNSIIQQDGLKEQFFEFSQNASKIDSLLCHLLEYLRNLHGRNCLQDTFYALLMSFEKLLLFTFKSKYIQFFIYYICSIENEYSEVFLGMLVSNLLKSNTISCTDICKGITSNYIASFVARASFLDSASIAWSFLLLLEWTDTYLANYEELLYSVEKHCVFFSVCQAIFYIFIFRHQELLNDSKIWYQIQNSLSRLINSTLNPLKICLTSVVQEFARIAADYQLVYCFAVMEKNRKIGSYASSQGNSSTLELLSMFPFDPVNEYSPKIGNYLPSSLFVEWKGELESRSSFETDFFIRNAPTPPNSCAPLNVDEGDMDSQLESIQKSSSYLLLNFNEAGLDGFLDI